MNRSMTRSVVGCVLLMTVGGLAEASGQNDPIAQRLTIARATFDAEIAKARAEHLAQVNLRLEAAQRVGELSLLKRLQAERDNIASGGEPTRVVNTAVYRAIVNRATVQFSSALSDARRAYTQAGKLAEAEQVDAELEVFIRSGGRRLPGGVKPQAQAGGVPAPRIISAVWGAGQRQADVTVKVTALIAQGKTVIVDGPVLGPDPAPNINKTLRVQIAVGDHILTVVIPDRGQFALSTAK